ncbi:MAG: host attachment protein [Nitrospiraceae bacterium]|nr:host attachment protein [Nitrospiraceae bacterium]
MNKIIITADLGHFKAYRVTKAPEESARVQLIESFDSLDGHWKFSERLSDKAGRFGKPWAGTATGSGEDHNIETENSKRIAKLISRDINELVGRNGCDGWYLAAAGKINNQILENLTPAVREKLEKNIAADLTRTGKSELLGHFH